MKHFLRLGNSLISIFYLLSFIVFETHPELLHLTAANMINIYFTFSNGKRRTGRPRPPPSLQTGQIIPTSPASVSFDTVTAPNLLLGGIKIRPCSPDSLCRNRKHLMLSIFLSRQRNSAARRRRWSPALRW